MPASSGDRVGPYEIVSLIGQGGMGEVWKARDTRLDRTVAIKFCKHEFESRFQREAHAVAALNHPHICTLHDVGPDYLVMEFIQGAPLHGPLPFHKVIDYSVQILDALDAAHRQGIVHRDLKPANILVARDGIKLLDFGLARQRPAAAQSEETVTKVLTGEGQVVGTLQYMSPEQLQGRPGDARSDLFSFGCVLYEMLTGKRAFDGQSAASVIAAVLEREPAPTRASPPLERILRTCLAKDPEQRFQSAADLKRALQWAAEPVEAGRPKSFGWLPAALGAAGLLAGLALGWVLLRPSAGLPFSRNIRITHDGQSFTPSLSPDGKLVAYASGRSGSAGLDIYVQQLSGQGTVRLTSDPAADTQPAFSADGAKVYFASAREPAGIYEVPTLGGDARLVMAGALSPSASPDGKWLACVRGGRVLVRPVSGGEGRVASAIRFSDFRPVWSPDGTRLAVMSGGDEGLSLIPVEGSSAVTLPFVRNLRRLGMFDQSYSVVQAWTPDGDLLFSAPFGSAVNIWRIPLRDAAGGRPAPVTLGSSELLPSFDARAGKLVYNAIESVQSLWSLPADLDRGTVLGPLRPFPTEKSNAYHQDVTSDGRFLAYVSRKGGTHGIWLMEVATGRERLLVQSGREDESYAHLQFSPNGSRIAATYSGYQGQGADRKPAWHIFVLDVAAGQTRQVARPGGRIRGWSPDGRYLVVWSSSQPVVVGVVDVESGALTPILKREGTPVGQPRLSPDGRWIAFLAGSALHVAPFRGNQPVPEAEWVRVAEPAGFPFWSPDGRNLYYTAAAQWEPVSALLLRQPFDPAAGRPKGPAVRFHALEGRTLGSPIINQVSGARGGVVLGLRDTVSDIWSLDWPPR